MVCVTSIGTDFTPSTFTNYGPQADIAAPGGDNNYHFNKSKAGQILSTVRATDGSYGYSYGTSMACPHASGVAALGLSYAKQLGEDVRSRTSSATWCWLRSTTWDPILWGLKILDRLHEPRCLSGEYGSRDDRCLQDVDGRAGDSGDHGRTEYADDDFLVEILRGCHRGGVCWM